MTWPPYAQVQVDCTFSREPAADGQAQGPEMGRAADEREHTPVAGGAVIERHAAASDMRQAAWMTWAAQS